MRHTNPRSDSYDVVVIGSGFGGITPAALLARAGLSVLVVERQEGPGGYAHVFRRGPYVIDPAVRYVGDPQLFEYVLDYLGMGGRCRFLPLDPFYTAAFPDYRIAVPRGAEKALAAHVREFPHEAAGFRELMTLSGRIHREAHQLPPQIGVAELDAVADRFPTLFGHLRHTLGEALDQYLTDPRLKSVISATWPYMGLPPSRLSLVTFSQFFYAHVGGSAYCQGSFQVLIDALVEALERHGGELVLNQEAVRIPMEDGRAAGVVLQDGTRVRARHVISNGDALRTFKALVGAEYVPPPFLRQLDRLTPSLSSFNVYAGTRLDVPALLGEGVHEIFYFESWDHEACYQKILEGQPWAMFIAVPTVADPSLAPPGEHLVGATALMPYDIGRPWNEARDAYTDMILERLETLLPGLRGSRTMVESASPETLRNYTLNHDGAMFGWASTPHQATGRRPHHQTPIPNLYLSGQWTYPGAGAVRCVLSGIHTAMIVLHNAGIPDALPGFAPSDAPPAR
jgi:prolycopene isomerase